MLSGVIFMIADARKTIQAIEVKYETDLIEKGTILSINSKIALRELARANAFADIREIVTNTVVTDNDIVYGLFTDAQNRPWTVATRADRLEMNEPLYAELVIDTAGRWADTLREVSHRTITLAGNRLFEFAAPVADLASERLGTVRYAFSTSRISDASAASKKKLYIGLSIFSLVCLTLITVLFVIQRYAAYRQARNITQPLIELTKAAIAMSSGNSTVPLSIAADDEIGILAEKFDDMRRTIRQYTENLEQLVEQRTRQLDAAQREKLMQANKLATLGTLVASVAHEINNPNNAILLSVTTLREIWGDLVPLLDNYAKEHGEFSVGRYSYNELRIDIGATYGRVIKNAQRIEGFVNDLKNFARKDSCEPLRDVDINEAVASAVRIIMNEIKKCTTRFSVEYGMNIPPIKGVQRHFEQIAMNLIQNACHALPGPEAGIFVSTLFDGADSAIVIKIKDEGAGMPPEVLKKIFDPFFTTKGDSGGTGLGLTVCAGIVRSYKGTLTFDSEPGKGTLATIIFPLSPNEETDERKTADPANSLR